MCFCFYSTVAVVQMWSIAFLLLSYLLSKLLSKLHLQFLYHYFTDAMGHSVEVMSAKNRIVHEQDNCN